MPPFTRMGDSVMFACGHPGPGRIKSSIWILISAAWANRNLANVFISKIQKLEGNFCEGPETPRLLLAKLTKLCEEARQQDQGRSTDVVGGPVFWDIYASGSPDAQVAKRAQTQGKGPSNVFLDRGPRVLHQPTLHTLLLSDRHLL